MFFASWWIYLDIKISVLTCSNQNSAQFRQVSACLNLATLHDKTCIISKIFLEKIDLKFSEKGQRNPKKASNDDLLMTYTKGF